MKFLAVCLCSLVSITVFAKKKSSVLEPIKRSQALVWPEKGRVDPRGCEIIDRAYYERLQALNRRNKNGFEAIAVSRVCLGGELHTRNEVRKKGKIFLESYVITKVVNCTNRVCTFENKVLGLRQFNPPKSMPL